MRLRHLLLGLGLLPLLAGAAEAQTTNGRVTTAAPTYTTGNTSPFSLTTGGALRIDIASITATMAVTQATASNLNAQVVGNVAAAATDSGNPVKVGGVYTTAFPTLSDGQRNNLMLDQKGGLLTTLISGDGGTVKAAVTTIADAQATSSGLSVRGQNQVWNGATWDRQPGTTLGLYGILRDAAGNARGANVNASNQLSVSVDNTVTVASHAVTNAGTFAVQAASTHASGSIASGAIASGAVASGAYASGSIGSGAIASGAVASGAYASGSISAGAIAAGATSLVKLEDVASADADAGVPAMCTRKATAANTSGTDGDYEFLECSGGRLWSSANIDQINAVTPLMGNGVTGTGSLRVTIASDNTAFSVNAAPTAATSGGTSLYTLTAANSTNAANVKASAGQVYSLSGYTISATAAWLSLYNTAGTPTCGTSIIQQFLIPGSASGAGFNIDFAVGKTFGTGIGICLTTGIAGTGSVAASSYVINIDYK